MLISFSDWLFWMKKYAEEVPDGPIFKAAQDTVNV